MTDKELIKQEIERRISQCERLLSTDLLERERDETLCVLHQYKEILQFIDSLPEEPASEDLDEAAEKYAYKECPSIGIYNAVIESAYKAGAEWQKSQMKEALQTEYEKGRFDKREEMLKDTIETTIVNDWQYGKDPDHTVIPAIHQRIKEFTVGDKVKIIISDYSHP